MSEDSRQIPRTAKPAKTPARGGDRSRRAQARGARAATRRYLIAALPPASARSVLSQLERDESCRVLRVLGGSDAGVAVAEMTPEHALLLASAPGVAAEPDTGTVSTDGGGAVTIRRVPVEVTDDGGRPVEGAAVLLGGAAPGLPATAFTDAAGHAEVTATPEALDGCDVAEIRPPRGCWPVRVRQPDVTGTVHAVCTRMTTAFPGFPDRALDAWGARVMGFSRLPPTYRGSGIRIALIGSGAAASHPDLSGQLEYGRDLLNPDEKAWQEDLTGTGTHHATLIAGRDDGTGINGLAAEAQAHIVRLAPGGTVASVLEALDYCLDQGIDVMLLTCGVPSHSALLAAKIDQAWQQGIACIAAAGEFPATLPRVLSVGAIGQLGTFPADSTDTTTLTGPVSPEGFFVPKFSPAGADCCAPGVAIVSGLPPASYGPLSGTGPAAAHVAALAALVLAHHPLFRPEPGTLRVARDATRPSRLYEVIKASCRPLPWLDPARIGAGLPDAAVALGLAPWDAYPPPPALAQPPDDRSAMAALTAAIRAAGLLPAP